MEINLDAEKHIGFLYENLDKCKDVDLTIIKGHILVEHHLNRFILSSVNSPEDFDDSKFSFAQKIQLSSMLGLRKASLREELILLNKLRNEIAHKLSYTERLLDNLISLVTVKYEIIKTQPTKILKLKSSITFICGILYASVGINNPDLIKKIDNEIEGLENER